MTNMLDCFPLQHKSKLFFHKNPFTKDVKYIVFATFITHNSAECNLLYYQDKPQEPCKSQ